MTKFNIDDLYHESVAKQTNVFRLLFDNHVYNIIEKQDFEASCRGHNNSMVQITENGLHHIDVRVKTKGIKEKIGNGK